ncbi:sensor domain-containing diguanylate cyclase [Thiomonas bhubaneswarensis]|uniref:Diguanylate cyclase (GGDEF) domain n=1 Tax=Thiomonas bhubaneswarensis TaxID=339866 RepID=A0A0K6HW13_9BURK|nr:diguanylate cyclase [Thiomonas bhubaneswarensis]CUA94993.1 diguanylate cyclase (GGDEF) domain [Thiomonas bhubaneswarensis]
MTAPTLQQNNLADLFELAPVSLWVEDFSALRELFDQWRAQGVSDLRAWLQDRPERVAECAARIKVLQVNRRTLELFEARDLEHLEANLDRVFRDDMHREHLEELLQLWNGATRYSSQTVNYTLSGRRLDVQLNAHVLPGHEASWSRVLFAIEDVSDRLRAERQLHSSEQYARGLFKHSPVSLWVEDFSAVRQLLELLRAQGITDFTTFLRVHPEFIDRCMQEIRVLDVNQQTLDLVGASDRAHLLRNLQHIFRDDMRVHFADQLIDLWHGRLTQQREIINYHLNGQTIHAHMQFAVMPGHTDDWAMVLVSLTDITARKKAEAYLEYLGTHDVLTGLRNRTFFADEINRLERKDAWPVSVLMLDLNSLKAVNDELGHAAGDALLRRAGEVLSKLVEKPQVAARVGGDEFVLLLPDLDVAATRALSQRLLELVELNNQFYQTPRLSFSMGVATRMAGERLETTINRADQQMYAAKRSFYDQTDFNRRQG